MKEIISWFSLNTVRKKVFFLSKITGGIIILFYVFASELPAGRIVSFIVWLILLIAVITLVDYMLGRFISKPLQEINHTAGQMAKLDFSAQCTISSNDEFGMLSQSLNAMSANLQDTLVKLEAANKQLEKDVEQERLLLSQRKELVDSLSHEMKTPLGIIRAYVEGLSEETDEEQKQKFVEVVLAAADRMNGMIVSLLDLSALEAGAAKLAEERFDFIELAETAAGRLLIDTPDTSFWFTYELPDYKVLLTADRHRLEQVLQNLIVNAINHTCDNGSIHLSITCGDRCVRFSIFNQGAPIPSEDIGKIWTKFYRGEGAHYKTPGSGLGLSIVSQILTMYHADFGVLNQPDGVTFYFEFHTDFTPAPR